MGLRYFDGKFCDSLCMSALVQVIVHFFCLSWDCRLSNKILGSIGPSLIPFLLKMWPTRSSLLPQWCSSAWRPWFSPLDSTSARWGGSPTSCRTTRWWAPRTSSSCSPSSSPSWDCSSLGKSACLADWLCLFAVWHQREIESCWSTGCGFGGRARVGGGLCLAPKNNKLTSQMRMKDIWL